MMKNTMKVAVLTGRMQMEVRQQPIPTIPPGGMLVRVHSCGLCGSDINRIRFTSSTRPRILGHEVAGEVVAVDNVVTKFKVGDRIVVGHVHVPCMHCVYCRHGSYTMCPQFKASSIIPGGYAEYVAIPSDQLMHSVLKIPDELSYAEATFVDPLACCLRALRLSTVRALDRVSVVGVGIMGLLFIQLLKLIGAQIFAFDISTARLDKAKEFGADHVLHSADPEAIKRVLSLTNNEGIDVVILTAANQATLTQSIDCVRDGGKICVFAPPPPDRAVLELDFYPVFRRELSIFGSYSSAPEDLEVALAWINSGKVDVKTMISGYTNLDGIVTAIANMDERTYKIIVEP